MKKHTMKTFWLIIALLGIVLITACGGNSNPYVGTWYEISDPSEANPNNYEFRSDGTVVNDGVEGSYTVEENAVTVNFFGSTATLYPSEYDGHDTLSYGEESVPYLAKSLEEAQTLHEELYNVD